MRIAQHVCVFVTVLLVIVPVRGDSDRPASAAAETPGKTVSQNTSTTPSPQPTAQPNAMPTESSSSKQASSSALESKESLSQLTLFLFGSGLALFIALLGWSDQIRGIDKDTKELEQRFLDDTGISKRDFLRIVKPQSLDEQLIALTQVVNDGGIQTEVSVDMLRTFKAWNTDWKRLERLSTWKYNLSIVLTVMLLIAGVTSLFTTPTQQVRLAFVSVRTEMLVLTLPMLLVSCLLIIIICSARREKALRSLLDSMTDMV